MRKVLLFSFGIALLCVSCAGSGSAQKEENVGITDEAYCEQLRSWGAADAFIDREDCVLSYGVVEGQVSGDPDAVARSMFDDAYGSGIRGIKECRVVLLPKGNMIGRYVSE